MIIHAGFFAIRRPFYRLDQLSEFNQKLSCHSFEALLREWYSQPLMQEAIRTTSESLYDRLQRWLDGREISEKEELLRTLYKYLIRACTRATPYGFFACSSFGKVDKRSKICFTELENVSLNIAPDLEWQVNLSRWLITDSNIRSQLQLYPNTNLYRVGTDLRFVERLTALNQMYATSALQTDEWLTLILAKTKFGSKFDELTGTLVGLGFDRNEAEEYLTGLIDEGVLEFDIGPRVTGRSAFDAMVSQIASMHNVEEYITALRSIQEQLTLARKNHKMLDTIRASMHSLLNGKRQAQLLKVDCIFPSEENTLSESVVGEIGKSIASLFPLNQNRISRQLARFKKSFQERYESAEVPLGLALDDEAGIGFGGGTSFVFDETIDFKEDAGNNHERETGTDDSWTREFTLQRFSKALREGVHEILLSDKDLDAISETRTGFHDNNVCSSFFFFGNLLAPSLEELDNGQSLINMIACRGPSAVNMLARFAGSDEKIRGALKDCAEREERAHPDVVFAEIVHAPEGRALNIMTRPNLYKYEIEYLGRSSLQEEFRLDIDDLLVSVRDGQVVLRSKRLNKRVIPRLSNMHNYRTGLPVYRFLCELQNQDTNIDIRWDWGGLAGQAYLPRVRYKNIILSRESWTVYAGELGGIGLEPLKDILISKRVPQVFTMVWGDNELSIDMKIPVSLDIVLAELRRTGKVTLMESLAQGRNALISNNGQAFHSEFVIPFFRNVEGSLQGAGTAPEILPRRMFLPGSEWLYVKIYAGRMTLDNLLSGRLSAVMRRLLDSGFVKQFFFVRYNDPDPHLRIRFQGNPAELFHQTVLGELFHELEMEVESRAIHKIQTDTYQRELERYGFQSINLFESIFYHDSLNTLNFLSGSDDISDDRRIIFSISSIMQMLTAMQFTVVECFGMVKVMRENLLKMVDSTRENRKLVGMTFSRHLDEMTASFYDGLPAPGMAPLLWTLREENPNEENLRSRLASVVHMSINRVFVSNSMQYEFLVLSCLYKFFDRQMAQSRYAEPQKAGILAGG